jgi:CheY-like chemotaxis protein
VAGALIRGVVTVRFGILRSLIICGVLQSAGNLFYVLKVRELKPDLILLDIALPKLNGIAAAPEIRKSALESNILLALLTSSLRQ